MLGGRISVKSAVGRGTEFTVSMPIESSSGLKFEHADGLTIAADQQQRSRDSIDLRWLRTLAEFNS
jgi:hypothetical protein